mgnify:FL=1
MRDSAKAEEASKAQIADVRAKRASAKLTDMAKKLGIADAAIPRLENALVGMIAADPELLARWREGDLTVVDDAFKSYQSDFVEPVARTQAASIKGIKATNKKELAPIVAGGTAGKPKEEPKPKTVDDAHSAALEALEVGGSDIPDEPES